MKLLEMGGYGAYVWSAYGFTVLLLGGLLLQSWLFERKQRWELAKLRQQLGPRTGNQDTHRPITTRVERAGARAIETASMTEGR